MTILNRRKFMQLLAGTAVAATVPLPPLPEVSAPVATSPSLAFKAMGAQFAQGLVDGINALTVTDITAETGGTRLDFESDRLYLREIPDWSTQIFTARGTRDYRYANATEQIEEEYQFLVESSEVPTGRWDEILEFVEGKLTPEHLTIKRARFEGFRQ